MFGMDTGMEVCRNKWFRFRYRKEVSVIVLSEQQEKYSKHLIKRELF